LFLVGNHDQIDLGGCAHSLTPLRLSRPDLIHVFDSPGFFRGALFLPYRRDKAVIQSAISAVCLHPDIQLKAIMAHADIVGARFNYAIQAREGVSIDLFPQVPVYSGHYHLPHTVPNTSIHYIGSTFQVTAAEAGEQKRLVVFDAEDGWSIKEEIPISIGPRHIRVASLDELESPALFAELRAGDRVRLTISNEDQSSDASRLELRRSALEARGIRVEVSRQARASELPRIAQAEIKTPDDLLEEYALRARLSNGALAIAKVALGEALSKGGRAGGGNASRIVKLDLGMLELEGYGPFKEVQQYNLASRGLRAIVGQNENEDGSDSNGSGKTTLVTAPLWCLTGDVLARSESGASALPIDAMLNDSSKEGRVKLEGTVNGLPFVVERAVRKGKTNRLSFQLDGEQLDTQEIKATQALIDEQFNTSLLRLAVFYGANDITTLLISEDAALKQILSQVVEMDVWSKSQSRVKEEQKSTQRTIDQADGKMSVLEQQRPECSLRLIQVCKESSAWDDARSERLQECEKVLEKRKGDSTLVIQQIQSLSSILSHGLDCIRIWMEELDFKSRHSSDEMAELEARLKTLSSSPPSIPAPTLLQSDQNPYGEALSWELISANVQPVFAKPLSSAEERVKVLERSLRITQDEVAELKTKADLILSQIERASIPLSSDQHDSSPLVCDKCLMEVDPSKHSQRLDQMNLEATEVQAKRRDKTTVISEIEAQKKAAEEEISRLKKEQQLAIQACFDEERIKKDKQKDKLRREQELALQAWQLSQSDASKEWEVSINSLSSECRKLAKTIQDVKDQQRIFKQTSKVLESGLASAAEVLGIVEKEQPRVQPAFDLSRQELVLSWQSRAAEVNRLLGQLQNLIQQSNATSARLQAIQDEDNPYSRQRVMIEQQIERLDVDLSELSTNLSNLQEHQAALEEAEKCLGRGGIQSFVLEGVLKEWEERSRWYLEQMTDGMLLELSATKTSTKKKGSEEVKEVIQKIVKIKKGSEVIQRSIQQLSGGERRRLAISLSLGFMDLVRARGRLSCNLLILDEVLQLLDSEGCSRVAIMLKSLPHETILVVGQARSFIESSIEIVDRVVKSSGSSFVSQQE
jgi:DNA repair exonuclease SbcCD ATPase subunit